MGAAVRPKRPGYRRFGWEGDIQVDALPITGARADDCQFVAQGAPLHVWGQIFRSRLPVPMPPLRRVRTPSR
jgi:hypothetical protein